MTKRASAGVVAVPRAGPDPNVIQNLDASWSGVVERDSLVEIEEEFQAILSNRIVGVAVTSPDKHWVRVNDEWSEMMGYSREELTTIDWTKLTHPDDLASDLAQFSRVLAAEIDHYSLEKRYIRKDGSTLYATISVNAIRAAGGRLKYAVGLAVDTTQGKVAEASLAEMRCQLIEAQEQERARIGRELHDDILQRLASLAMDIGRVAEVPSEIPMRLQGLRAQVDEISREVQALSHDLHASDLEYLGGVSGIRSWCIDFARRHNLVVAFNSNVQNPLPRPIAAPLFRIAQEALHNALKHSGTNQVEIDLAEISKEVHLLIRDAGRGFNLEDVNGGLGLVSMRERARLIGGSMTIDSKPDHGTSISVNVPLR
jgi:PAS domain S-box-containing protein